MATAAPPLLPLFRSDAQLRLVGELFLSDETELSVGELVERTAVPQATVSRELSRLERHGLVRGRRAGNLRLVSANWELPWAHELRSILAQTIGPLASLSTELRGMADVAAAFVFGSWAARFLGEAGSFPHDIDVLVVGDPDRRALMKATRAVESRLRVEVNSVVIDPGTWSKPERGSFVAQVKRGPLVPIKLDHQP